VEILSSSDSTRINFYTICVRINLRAAWLFVTFGIRVPKTKDLSAHSPTITSKVGFQTMFLHMNFALTSCISLHYCYKMNTTTTMQRNSS